VGDRSWITDKPEVILSWRKQANALIEPSRWIYVFGRWTKNRLSVEMTLHGCREADYTAMSNLPTTEISKTLRRLPVQKAGRGEPRTVSRIFHQTVTA
jgi:hypothetical protein